MYRRRTLTILTVFLVRPVLFKINHHRVSAFWHGLFFLPQAQLVDWDSNYPNHPTHPDGNKCRLDQNIEYLQVIVTHHSSLSLSWSEVVPPLRLRLLIPWVPNRQIKLASLSPLVSTSQCITIEMCMIVSKLLLISKLWPSNNGEHVFQNASCFLFFP
jgi:hypothetical protein